MALDARAVANYFLDLARAEGKTLDPIQVQKLVYFAHGWHLAITGAALVNDIVEAQPYGIAIPSLYREFRAYGSSPIADKAEVLDWSSGKPRSVQPSVPSDTEHAFVRSLLNRIWEVFGSYDGMQLSGMTLTPGSPWEGVWRPGDAQGKPIPDEMIASYFRTQVNAA